MAESTVPVLKATLTEKLQARPLFANVQVTYGPPLPNPSREFVWLADAEGEEEPAALGRNHHKEVYYLTILIQVERPGTDQQAATDRAYEFRDEIDAYLRSDITVSGALGSGWAYVGGRFSLQELAGDQKRGALLEITVSCEART